MNKPRVAIGGFQHETNTFAPLPTTWEHFKAPGAWPGLTEGAAILDVFQGSNIPISGFIAATTNWELVPMLWAAAEPAGYVTNDAFDHTCDRILAVLDSAGPLDGIYLDLHGAMVTETHQDGEAELLRRVRSQVGTELPVVVSLDLHGNLSPEFYEHASAVSIYRTYPHVDMAATGKRAHALLSELLARTAPFARAWRQLDYIIPIVAQSTLREPGKQLYNLLPELTGNGVSSVDFAFGFPPADIHHNGATVCAYGTDQAAVDQAADTMISALRDAETAFRNPMIPANAAVRQAMQLAESASQPVVIADPQDNPGAGGIGNTTGLLHALLDEGAQGAALSMLWDAETAKQAHAAGEGAELDVSLGAMHAESGPPPVKCRAVVERLSDGKFAFHGPMYGGSTAQLGLSACLHLLHPHADVRVIVGSVRCQNADQAMFSALGVDPTEQNILGIKSAIHFLNDYESIAHEVLFAESPGANNCQIDALPFKRLRPGVRLGPGGPVFQ